VLLPTTQTEVRATRAELEAMIQAPLNETIGALRRALRSAGVEPAGVDHVLLVGGSSRIPMVAGLVSTELGRPVAVDAHPKHAIALGAAIVAARVAGVAVHDAALAPAAPSPVPAGAAVAAAIPAAAASVATATTAPPPAAVSAPPGPGAPPFSYTTPAASYGPPGSSPPPQPPAAPQPPPAPVPPAPVPPAPPAPPSPAYAAPAVGRPSPGSPGPASADGSGWDPTFDAARTETPGPSLGYRTAGMPPPPGTSTDLPPGYMTDEQRSSQQRRKRRKGRIGMVVGVLILVACIVITLALTAEQNEPSTLADVEVGQCFLGTDFNDLQTVDCDQPHHGELVAVLDATDPGAAHPGEDALHQQHDEACAQRVEEYFGGTRDVLAQRGVQIYPIPPTEAQWNDGLTTTFCYVGAPDRTRTVPGSIAGLGATTTAPPPAP
jgi:hypothetical protein